MHRLYRPAQSQRETKPGGIFIWDKLWYNSRNRDWPTSVGGGRFLFGADDVMSDTNFINLDTLRELFSARFDALDAKLDSIASYAEKENYRQDEAIERLADRTTHVSETKRLTERVIKLEDQIERGRSALNGLKYKTRVTWGIITGLGAIVVSILVAMIKGWIGL